MLLHRRLTDARIRATSTFADTGILALLLLQLVIGLGTIIISLDHLDGGTMVQFMNYSRAIFTFQADAWLRVVDVHWLFKLHIALGLFIFVLFPFTRLVHMLSVPVRYLWRPGYQIVRSRGTAPRLAAGTPGAGTPGAGTPGKQGAEPHSTPAE
jgi:nitrate reductase gamma subunit